MKRPFADRWWWSPPWKVTRPWLPRVQVFPTGGDEYCNPTVLVVLPLLGDVVVRYRRGPIRTQACDECVAENGPWCAGCQSCHEGPRCHPWGLECRCPETAALGDCPACGGMYCTVCEPTPDQSCDVTIAETMLPAGIEVRPE